MMANATTDEQKAMLEKMAQTWDTLAADRERRATQKERIAELDQKEPI